MSGCSLVAAGLPSLIGTATPTFSYDQARHSLGSGDEFGIQMTYMSGTSTCYQGTRPTFTPIISNPYLLYTRTCSYLTQGSPATYTGIYCNNADLWNWVNLGVYTLDNYQFLNIFANTPRPFTATFGDQPAPSTVATTTVLVTSTATNTAVAPVQPAATTTVTSASSTSTRTNTATVTFPVTSPFTQTVTSCPTSSSPSPSPIASSSSAAPIVPSSSPVSTTTVVVVSTTTPSPNSSSSPTPIPSSSSSSVATTTVVVVSTISPTPSSSSSPSPIPSPSLSSSPSPIPSSSSSSVATTTVLVVTTATPTPSSTLNPSPSPAPSSSASSSPASSSVTPTSASPAPSASALSCPASNGATFSTSQGNFIVECFVDRNNNDIGIAPNNPATYEQCIQACASTAGCQAVSYLPNSPCYLKNGLGDPGSNSAVWGARIASVPVASSSVVSTSSARSSSSAVATTTVVSTTVVTASSSSSSAASPVASASCPGSNGATVTANGQQYLVECSADYTGGDIPGPMSPTYPGSYERCLADCSSTAGCVAVSYVMGGPCYLKNAVSGARTNANIIGGRLVSSISTSAALTSSSAATSSSVATSSRITSSSSAAATSSAPVTSAAPAPGPSTVTVTTTISNTAYQCACTPASVFSSSSSAPAASPTGASVTCPGSNGSTFMTSCGALYAVECGADRFGNDLPNGLVYTNTYEQCLQACDTTTGCVNVSWVMGKPGACYMKGSSGAIQNNMNIIGGRKLSGCSTLKLHRKRVAVAAPKQKLAKRAGFFGPDFTFTQDRVTATATATVRTTVSTTTTPLSGTATQTAFTLASATVTTTTSAPTTVYNIISITTCPTATPTL